MDRTETYIKMCEKAEEIQEHSILYDDWIFLPKGHTRISHFRDCRGNREGEVWLPRQDQLQEMVDGDCVDWFWNGIKHNAGRIYYEQFTSMEQLWLAFVMKEKYNKIWDGEVWK